MKVEPDLSSCKKDALPLCYCPINWILLLSRSTGRFDPSLNGPTTIQASGGTDGAISLLEEIGRDSRTRTDDLMLPKHPLYQAELHPVKISPEGDALPRSSVIPQEGGLHDAWARCLCVRSAERPTIGFEMRSLLGFQSEVIPRTGL